MAATTAAAIMPPLKDRPVKNTICLFDVDGTLSPARRSITEAHLAILTRLRTHVAIGFVGGSNLVKQQEQLGTASVAVTSLFDFCFSENGLTAYRMGVPLASSSFIQWLGEDKYKLLVRWILHYIADLDLPVKRGTFIEFRNGMINVSPVGRNASQEERDQYEKYDLQHKIRATMIEHMTKEFPDAGLTYSIGGQISFDVFPTGWDKTYCLQHLEAEKERKDGDAMDFKTIHFFGDKTYKGGNDYEIYEDPRTVGHAVKNPNDTFRIIKELFPEIA
ncbi:MAG: Phosphomannomutase [Chrysothrix sp. TS-e1954]|nr:MAG: Phosphomannomutase [Chrysothrix sp. TS-e1954]